MRLVDLSPRSRTRPRASPRRSPTRSAPAAAGRATSPSSIASTPCRGASSSRCASRAFPTRWSTAWSSTSARKSRTCWPICTCSTIRATTSRLLRMINTPPRGIGKSTIDAAARACRRPAAVAARRGPRERPDRVAQQAGGRGRGQVRRRCSIACRWWRRRAGRGNPGPRAQRVGLSRVARGLGRRGRPGAAGQHRGIADRGPRSSTNSTRATGRWRRFWKKPAWSTTPTPGRPTTTASR